MKQPELTPSEIQNGRKSFFWFLALNVISFQFLSGNIITLYTLRLGGGNALVGLISSFAYLSFTFLIVGRMLLPRLGAVKLQGYFFILRYLLMVPALLIPLFLPLGIRTPVFILLSVSVFFFNISRGIALTGDTPIVAELAGKKDKGVFLSQIQLIQQIIGMAVGFSIAFFLGDDAPITQYTIFLLIGIIVGFISVAFLLKVPEPPRFQEGITQSLLSGLAESIKRPSLRRLYIILFLSNLGIAMGGPFLIVYFKQVYGFSDSSAIILGVVGSLGALFMATVSGLAMDRLGSKPLLFAFTGITLAVLLPAIASPSLTGIVLIIFASAMSFLQTLGMSGIGNASRSYFFGLIEPKQILNQGIIYYLIIGIAGAIGANIGGLLLDSLTAMGYSPAGSFRIFFTIIAAFFLVCLLVSLKLHDSGGYPIFEALSFIFSPRDMRTLNLLRRLTKTTNIDQEEKVLTALKAQGSQLSQEEILSRCKSPSYFIRTTALNALHELTVDENIAQYLISEVKNHSHVTGYIAAEIMGEKHVTAGIKVLRRAMNSSDSMLVSKSLISLAQLGDDDSREKIERIVSRSNNPRIIIHGIKALTIFKHPGSLPILISRMKEKTAPFLRDELILGASDLLGFIDWFYPHYTRYLERGRDGISGLLADLDKWEHEAGHPAFEIHEMTDAFQTNRADFTGKAVRAIEASSPSRLTPFRETFMSSFCNPDLMKLDRFCFLSIAYLIRNELESGDLPESE